MKNRKLVINDKLSLNDVLLNIDNNKSGFIIIVNKNKKVVGVLSDGDIRRLMLKKISLNSNVKKYMNKDFVKVNENDDKETILKLFDEKIKFLPVVNNEGKFIDVYKKENLPLDPENKLFVRSKSPVRISFGGGGSDTTNFFKNHKGAVINSTISIFTHCTLNKRDDDKITIDSLDLNSKIEFKNIDELNKYKDGAFSLIVSTILTVKPDFGFDLYINSDYPISSGLGGSAAVVTSILGCFNELRNDKWTNHEISEIAYQIERLRLDVDGGWQDQYATAFGGINHMEFNDNKNYIYSLRLKNEFINELEESLVLCYTGIKHDSGNIHKDQKKQTNSPETIKKIKENVKITQDIKNYLIRGNISEIGNCLHKSWQLKKSFSKKISNKILDDMYDGALKNGATGGKLLGAGGGGYFLFFVPYKEKNKLISWIKSKNLVHTPFNFEPDGLKSWKVRKKYL